MITAQGYSKDPNIQPIGIAVTFGRDMIAEKGTLREFLYWFEDCVRTENGLWIHKCKNRPTQDIIYVYVIIYNRVMYRCFYGGYHKEKRDAYTITRDGGHKVFQVDWPFIYLAGPFVKAPKKIVRPGFQGFRYTTELF